MIYKYSKFFIFLIALNMVTHINSIIFKNLLHGEKIDFFGICNDEASQSLSYLQYDLNKKYILESSCFYIIATDDYRLVEEYIKIINKQQYTQWYSSEAINFLEKNNKKFVKLDIRYSHEDDEFEKFLAEGILCSERNEDGKLIFTKFAASNYQRLNISKVRYMVKRIAENDICVLNNEIDLLIKSLKNKDDLKKRDELQKMLEAVNKRKLNLAAIENSIYFHLDTIGQLKTFFKN